MQERVQSRLQEKKRSLSGRMAEGLTLTRQGTAEETMALAQEHAPGVGVELSDSLMSTGTQDVVITSPATTAPVASRPGRPHKVSVCISNCVAPSGRLDVQDLAAAAREDVDEIMARASSYHPDGSLKHLPISSPKPHGAASPPMLEQMSSFGKRAVTEEMVAINLPEVRFNWKRTFRHMVLRRLERYLRGTFQKQRKLSGWKILTLLFVILAVGLVTFNFDTEINHVQNGSIAEAGDLVLNFSINLQQIFGENLWDALGWMLTGCIVLLVSLKIVEVVRWCVFWLVIGVTVYLILQGVPSIREDPKHQEYLYINLGITLGFEVLTVLAYFLVHYLYPKAVEHEWKPFDDLEWYWGVEQMPGQPSKFSYAPKTIWPFSAWLGMPNRHFGYEGELDADGRPHGVGTWHVCCPASIPHDLCGLRHNLDPTSVAYGTASIPPLWLTAQRCRGARVRRRYGYRGAQTIEPHARRTPRLRVRLFTESGATATRRDPSARPSTLPASTSARFVPL